MRTSTVSSSFLLMTLCTLALSAPTLSPSSLASDEKHNLMTMVDDIRVSTSEPIMDATVLEESTTTTTTTTVVPVTTADENLIITTTTSSSSLSSSNAGVVETTMTASMQTENVSEESSTTTVHSSSTVAVVLSTEAEAISTEFPSTTTATTTTLIQPPSTTQIPLSTVVVQSPQTTTTVRPIDKSQSKKLKLKDTMKKSWNVKDNKPVKKFEPEVTTATQYMLSTAIKTVPTTIKSTTLTTTTTTEEEKFVATTTTTTQQPTDSVIVLNSNISGLIVVDVMDTFGKAANTTASNFEIKMDLIEDEIFTTTIVPSMTTVAAQIEAATTTSSDELILVKEATQSTAIKWNKVRHNENSGDIKITFDNIDLPRQNVNVTIENGELVIDSIDISVLNRVEEELRMNGTESSVAPKTSNNSLEIVLIEEPVTTTTIAQHQMANDDIKIKTTDKDSDTIFYISNTEVKLIESIPTPSPNDTSHKNRRPAIYEEDVIVDVPSATTIVKNHTLTVPQMDKYEEDIVLSPLTSDFDPKDINYIGEAFLDVEESSNGQIIENHHIIPLTSDVVVQPVELKDMPSINVPIIGEPPQIELAEMMFGDDYDSSSSSKQQTGGFHMDEFSPFLINSRLVKNELQADEPSVNGTQQQQQQLVAVMTNKTLQQHSISVNTVINGTNVTTIASPLANTTAAIVLTESTSDDIDSADMYDIQTLLAACLATLAPLFLIVIIALIIRYCWQKYRRGDGGSDMISDKSTDPLAAKSIDDIKSTESAISLNRGNGNLNTQSTELLLANANGDVTPSSNGCNHNDTNGSIIKMTMKNNHLIVETEERNDISRDTRETKMHYSPSEKDGVFIVEAARGADQNGSHKPSPLLQKSSNSEQKLEIPDEIKIDTLQSHFQPSSPEDERKQQHLKQQAEQVEVHTPPAEIKVCNGTKTGLSQSDLSLTSSNSSNQNYTYGDRDAYQYEDKGYRGSSPKRVINVHCHDLKPLIENSPPAPTTNGNSDNKPVITSAIFKEDNEPLKSDMQATTNGIATTPKVHKMNGIIKSNGIEECNGELDSLSYLPAPPPVVEDGELMSMDSFPPPPPLES